MGLYFISWLRLAAGSASEPEIASPRTIALEIMVVVRSGFILMLPVICPASKQCVAKFVYIHRLRHIFLLVLIDLNDVAHQICV